MLSAKLKEVFEKYNGTVPTKIALDHGINKETLRKAELRGDLERYARGVYILPESMQDDYFSVQTAKSKGIFSHYSSLMLWDYGTFIPEKYFMTFPRGYNSVNFERDLIFPHFVPKAVHELGLTKVDSHLGNSLKVYDKERTVLDMLDYTRSLHTFVIKEMLEEYMDDPDKDLDKLYNYAVELNRVHLLKEVDIYNVK